MYTPATAFVSRAALVLICTAAMIFVAPASVLAFPFGGAAATVQPCYNTAIYVHLGPPRGGPFVWTPATRTYSFGAPQHSGQWLLGLAGANYFCVVNIQSIIVWPGANIMMMGSSR